MESIDRAIRYPMNRDNWVTTVIIGGILSFFSFLLIPILLVYGLAVRAIADTLSGRDEPPVFEDWGDLLVDGVQAWVIGLIYTIIPIVLFWLVIGSAILGAIGSGGESVGAAIAGAFLGFTVVALISLVFGYVASVGIVNFAREGNFGAGFDFDVIKEVAMSGEYAIAFIVAAVLFIVVGFVVAIPFLGWILSPFLYFYVALVAARLLGTGFEDARSTM